MCHYNMIKINKYNKYTVLPLSYISIAFMYKYYAERPKLNSMHNRHQCTKNIHTALPVQFCCIVTIFLCNNTDTLFSEQ